MAWLDEVRAELRQAESKKRRLEGRLPGGYRRIEDLQCEDERLTFLINEYSDLRRCNTTEMHLVLASQGILEDRVRDLRRAIKLYVLPDIPAKRKSRSKAEDFDQIAKFATTNSILIFVAILDHTQQRLFPDFSVLSFITCIWANRLRDKMSCG
jgi:hypothetical protein